MIHFTEVGEVTSMKKKIFLFILSLILILLLLLFFFGQRNVRENVYDLNYSSGDEIYKNSDSYDIWVNDDSITFSDELGNSIVYLFEADRLSNVYSIYVTENEVEARKFAAYFSTQIGNGQIEDVNYNENIVSVIMDMDYFAQYKDYTKKQIEDILLKDAEVIEED